MYYENWHLVPRIENTGYEEHISDIADLPSVKRESMLYN